MRARHLAPSLTVLGFVASAGGVLAETHLGTWTGTYVCGQGITGVTLTVEPVDANAVRVVMEFYATAQNPGVPSGRYTLNGVLDPSSGRLRLTPDYWLAQPPGYTMVGLDGYLKGERFTGAVTGNARCSTFSVTRQAGRST